jgi:hypothetical protein
LQVGPSILADQTPDLLEGIGRRRSVRVDRRVLRRASGDLDVAILRESHRRGGHVGSENIRASRPDLSYEPALRIRPGLGDLFAPGA